MSVALWVLEILVTLICSIFAGMRAYDLAKPSSSLGKWASTLIGMFTAVVLSILMAIGISVTLASTLGPLPFFAFPFVAIFSLYGWNKARKSANRKRIYEQGGPNAINRN